MNKAKVQELMEKVGFNVTYSDEVICLQQHTPAGEDWNIEVDVNELADYLDDVDAFDEMEDLIKSEVRGLPHISILTDDAKWKNDVMGKAYTLLVLNDLI